LLAVGAIVRGEPTDTDFVVVEVQLRFVEAVTVYTCVPDGEAVTDAPVVADKPVLGDHAYVDAGTSAKKRICGRVSKPADTVVVAYITAGVLVEPEVLYAYEVPPVTAS